MESHMESANTSAKATGKPGMTDIREATDKAESAAKPEDLKKLIGTNIAALRQSWGMTQSDLAARLNYTDKAVSKWERGESTPDITVLKAIADIFGVPVDDLLKPEVTAPPPAAVFGDEAHNIRTRGVVTGISILLVWFVATVLFTILETVPVPSTDHWLVFAYAIPASFVLWLVLNSIWFDRRRNYLIISLLMWSVIGLAYLSVWRFTARHIWMTFLLGLPGQAIILLWSRLKKAP